MGGKRKSGVLLHISSLPGEYSIGSLGGEAREFVDFLAKAGFGIWQILPLSRTDGYFSPYKSVSSFGANPFLIDLFTLYEKGLLTSEELYSARQKTPYLCEFERLFAEREELLYRAIEVALENGKISTSLLQRKLSVGFGKAARMIDKMEEMGLVSPPNGQKPREILVTMDEYRAMRLKNDE